MPDDPKPQRLLAPAYALGYAVVLPALVRIAREHGYALAVHGSMATDLDLIAVPWTTAATDAETLIEAIREAVGGEIRQRPEGQPEHKPNGRLAWSIHPPYGGLYLDVSVTPKG